MPLPPAQAWNFDVDVYLNRIVPRPRLDRLPRFISRFLGYRDASAPPIGNLLVACWALLGGFCGVSVLSGLFMSDWVTARGGPIIIGSFGAAAVLEYGAIESPFSQPRNAILGQVLSTVVGVGVTKLFQLSPHFDELSWLAGALAVGIASALMTLTKTIHPPAGATALLAATTPDITRLGWMYVPIVLVCSLLMLSVACLLNNIQRRFPVYWWTAADLAPKTAPSDEEAGGEKKMESPGVVVSGGSISTPPGLFLTAPERGLLLELQARMARAQYGHQPSETDGDSQLDCKPERSSSEHSTA